jgi:NADPH:quinone reductase-like Zn-dependent oxidoreductase
MLAGVSATYGPPGSIEMTNVPYPEPGQDQVLVRVAATTVNPADWHLLRGEPYIARLQVGLRSPKYPVLGCEVAGTIEAVGPRVSHLSPGDAVIASTFMEGFGGFAELAVVDQSLVVKKPDGIAMDAAATLPLAGCTALQAVRDHGRVAAGQRVLIIGASGGVGTFAVQLAKHFGAEVTGVCSGRNAELVTALGADRVIDYTSEDLAVAGRHDVVLQLAGERSIKDCRSLLTDRGTMLTLSGDSPGRWIGPASRLIGALLLNPFVKHRLGGFTVRPNAEDMTTLAELVADGTVTPVIDRTYPLTELADAITYLETSRAKGKVIVVP